MALNSSHFPMGNFLHWKYRAIYSIISSHFPMGRYHWNYRGNNANNSGIIPMGKNLRFSGEKVTAIKGIIYGHFSMEKIIFTIEIIGELCPLIPVKFQWKKKKLPLKNDWIWGPQLPGNFNGKFTIRKWLEIMATTTVTFQWEILHWNYGGNNARNSSQISMGNYFFSIGNIGELGASIPVIFQWKKLFLPLKLWGSYGV